jgi:zinc protease
VIVVGDVSVERTLEVMSKTIAALPARTPATLHLTEENAFVFPAATPKPLESHHTGPQAKAAVAIAWPAPDQRQSFQDAASMQVLAQIFRLRMTDAIRSNAGAGYSPNVSYEGSWTLTGYGRLLSYSDITPERVDVFFNAASTVAENLRNQPVLKDEFDRAVQPLLANLERARQTNQYFSQRLAAPEIDAQRIDFMRQQTELLKNVTPASVQQIARRYLMADRAWKAVVLPRDAKP